MKHPVYEYKRRLRKAFPKELYSDLNKVFEIIPFKDNVVRHSNYEGVNFLSHLMTDNEYTVQLDNQELTIPEAVFFNEPAPKLEKSLTQKQQDILNCIYLRHYDGFVREKRLKLISDNAEK